MSERITGYGHEEAMQMNIGQIVAPEYLPMVLDRVKRQVYGEEFKTPLELEIVCKDGSRMALEINTRVLVEIPRRFGDRFADVSEGGEVNAGFDFVFARNAGDQFAVADVALIKRDLRRDHRPMPAR
jgi:PAS domain S-box-containing protein